MKLTKEEKSLRNSSAESFAGLSIGLWTVSIIGYQKTGVTGLIYFMVILGILSILFGLYLVIPWNWKQKFVLENFKTDITLKLIKLAAWLIVLVVFAINLIQTEVNWLVVIGIITGVFAFIIFLIGLFRMNKYNNKKEKQI